MILNDIQILELQSNSEILNPYTPELISKDKFGNKIISRGQSSFGYDISASDDWRIFSNVTTTIVDPKNFDENALVQVSGNGYCIIPPNSFALAKSVEYLKVPDDIFIICLGKSTYARCGIVVNVTPLEPGWEGNITLEFSNTTQLPAKIYANEGVAQLVFFRSSTACLTTYRDRNGKYQYQKDVTVPRL